MWLGEKHIALKIKSAVKLFGSSFICKSLEYILCVPLVLKALWLSLEFTDSSF